MARDAVYDQAQEAIAEMVDLGCRFEIEDGPGGAPVFTWYAKPANMRDAVSTYWKGLDKLPGLKGAMTAILMRQKAEAAL